MEVKGAIHSSSSKAKLSATSSAESEVAGAASGHAASPRAAALERSLERGGSTDISRVARYRVCYLLLLFHCLSGPRYPGEKLTHPESTWNGRANRWDLAERAVHVGFEFEEFARLSLSFLRLRAGALWKEAEGAGGRLFGFEGHVFLR